MILCTSLPPPYRISDTNDQTSDSDDLPSAGGPTLLDAPRLLPLPPTLPPHFSSPAHVVLVIIPELHKEILVVRGRIVIITHPPVNAFEPAQQRPIQFGVEDTHVARVVQCNVPCRRPWIIEAWISGVVEDRERETREGRAIRVSDGGGPVGGQLFRFDRLVLVLAYATPHGEEILEQVEPARPQIQVQFAIIHMPVEDVAVPPLCLRESEREKAVPVRGVMGREANDRVGKRIEVAQDKLVWMRGGAEVGIVQDVGEGRDATDDSGEDLEQIQYVCGGL